MRKVNIELNKIKLAQKEIQLKALEAQLRELQTKVEFVSNRLNEKTIEVNKARDLISNTEVDSPNTSVQS